MDDQDHARGGIQEEEKKTMNTKRSTTYYNKIVIWQYRGCFEAFDSPIIELPSLQEVDDYYNDDEEFIFSDPQKSTVKICERLIKRTVEQCQDAKKRYRLEMRYLDVPRLISFRKLLAKSIEIHTINYMLEQQQWLQAIQR